MSHPLTPSSSVSLSARRLAFLLAGLGPVLHGAEIFKADNEIDMSSASSWVDGVLPGEDDIVVFDSRITGPAPGGSRYLPLTPSATWKGVKIAGNADGLVFDTFFASPTPVVTLGSGGIDMSGGTSGTTFTFDAPTLAIPAGSGQSWKVADGATLRLMGAFSRGTGSTLNYSLGATGTGVIVVDSSTFGTSGALTTFATANATDLAAVTVDGSSRRVVAPGASVVTYAANPSTADALPNFSGTVTVMDFVNANTNAITGVRISASAGISATGLRFNQPHTLPWVIDTAGRNLNVGNGALLVTPNVGATPVRVDGSGNLRMGAGQDFYLHQHNTAADVVINSAISQSGTNPTQAGSRLTKSGPGKVILASDGNNLWGTTTINEGTLQIGNGGTTGRIGASTVGTVVVNNVTYDLALTNVVNHGTLEFNRSNTHAVPVVISGTGQLTHSGTGTMTLSAVNTFTGPVNLNAGKIAFSAPENLGAGDRLNFGGGGLQWASGNTGDISDRVLAFNAGGAVLDTNGNDVTLANPVGAGGSGGLVKQGSGTLTLAAANDFSGASTVAAGVLDVVNTTGSATGSGPVSVAGGAVLSGTGAIAGPVTVASAAKLSPGSDGVGTLTVGGLGLEPGSLLDIEFSGASSHDKVVVTNPGGLSISGGALNLYATGGASPYAGPGVYNLFEYSGSVGGAGVSALSVLNPQAGYSYAFGVSGGFVTLEILVDSILSEWSASGSGGWGASGNWSAGVPSGDYTAQFTASLGAPATITLDGNRSVNGMVFSSAPNGYTIAQGTGGTLTFFKSGAEAPINVILGDHVISAPIALSSDLAVSTEAGASLTLSGAVSGAGAILKSGPGLLDLTGHGTFTGGVTVAGGVLAFSHADSLGTGAVTLNGGTLRYNEGNTADVSSRLVLEQHGGVIDTNGNDVIFADPVSGPGGLTKAGAGVLALDAAGTYEGGTTVTGGVLQVSDNTFLGPLDVALTLDGGAFSPAATLALETTAGDPAVLSPRAVVLGAEGGAFTVNAGHTLTVRGVISGSGLLAKDGDGTLVLPSASAINTGGFRLEAGVVNLAANIDYGASSAVVGAGALTFAGGTLTHSQGASRTLVFDNAIVAAEGTRSSWTTPNRFRLNSAFSGGGTLDMAISTDTARADFQNNFSGFTGDLNLTGSGVVRLGMQPLAGGQPVFTPAGWANTTLSVDGVALTPTTNSGGNDITIGALKSAGSAGVLAGGTAGAPNYIIGGKTSGGVALDTTFGGSFTGNAIVTKVGDGRLTLTGTANMSSGALNANAGVLDLRGAFTAYYRSSGPDGTAGNADDYSTLTEPTDGFPWTLVQPGAVTVAATGTLGGNGTLGGAVVVNGSLRPDATGALGGDLTLVGSASLTLAETATTQFDFGGANFTGVKSTATGANTYGGALKFNFLGTVFSGSYQVFDLAVAPTGAFSGVSVTTSTAEETPLTDNGSGVWSGDVGAQSYSFDAATGVLTVTGGGSAVTPGSSSLNATAGAGTVDLSWTSASGADTYAVKRSTTQGGPYADVVANLGGTSYSDATVANGTTYYYVVQARNSSSGLVGPLSNEVSATPVAAPSHSSLQSWRFEQFGVYDDDGTVLAGDAEDFDGDGLVNLLEYALGTDPKTPNASPVAVGKSGDNLTLTYPRRNPADASLAYTVEASSNLTSGFTAATGTTETVGSTSTYTDDVDLGAAGVRRFLRLSVSYTPAP